MLPYAVDSVRGVFQMNWTELEGKWEKLKGEAKVQWNKFTEEDLKSIGGKLDRLTQTVADRYGVKKEQAQKEVDEWANKLRAKFGAAGNPSGEAGDAASRAAEPKGNGGPGAEPPR
jgi:uncharacterized protein YjbJ (UPF0337 family)